jgi:hypothetical protein
METMHHAINSSIKGRGTLLKNYPIYPVAKLFRATLEFQFSGGENMQRLRDCLEGETRKCVEMILLTDDAERAIETKLRKRRSYFSSPQTRHQTFRYCWKFEIIPRIF